MTAARTRLLLRWSHVAIGVLIGAYVFSPLHADPTATLLARVALIPVVGLTGVAMWQQARLNRLLARRG
jgi:hypothetical protein